MYGRGHQTGGINRMKGGRLIRRKGLFGRGSDRRGDRTGGGDQTGGAIER